MQFYIRNFKLNTRPSTRLPKLAAFTGRYAYDNNELVGIVQAAWRHYVYFKANVGTSGWVNTRTTNLTFGCEMTSQPK